MVNLASVPALVPALTEIGAILANAPRLAYWISQSEHRLVCSRGHTFTPGAQNRSGALIVQCPGSQGFCGSLLVVVEIEGNPKRLVAEVTKADLEHMDSERMRPDSSRELAYLLTQAVR